MTDRKPTFCLVGAAGYIAPRHVDAIHEIGGRLVGAVDCSDSLGVLDRYGEPVETFPDLRGARWENWMRRRAADGDPVDWVVVATPNDLHVPHAIAAMKRGANVLCEKPLALYPSDLDALAAVEAETGRRVFAVLQMRESPALAALRAEIAARPRPGANDLVEVVRVTYVTPRGPWYDRSWKGHAERSGGLETNIGVHLFDLIGWLFGSMTPVSFGERNTGRRASGRLRTPRCDVEWSLSVEREDAEDGVPVRRMTLPDGRVFDLGVGFDRLHAAVYRRTLAGNGWGIDDARPAVSICSRLRR